MWASVQSTDCWPELAVVRVDVGAAAVLEVPRDRVVVVAVDRRDRPLLDQRAHLVGVRAVADQVPAAVDALDLELVDPPERGLERREVGVDIGDHRDGVGHAPKDYLLTNISSIDICI